MVERGSRRRLVLLRIGGDWRGTTDRISGGLARTWRICGGGGRKLKSNRQDPNHRGAETRK
uniref:Uncharacterized protein n=1 Tax=Arundo donax TaxID=35708 RepID=A0A0A8XY47_ARUDO